MRTFLIIWVGQLASLLGSEMTNFAITIWAWQVTGQATPLSLIAFFTQTPRIIAALFAGVLVDRWPRQQLMRMGDLMAGFSTIAILFLFLTNNLAIWHLYCTAAINSFFGFLQALAYSASLSLIVPKQHYARATALNSIQMSGSYVLAPALAGALYVSIGLIGILSIDIVTFIIAIASLTLVKIPQPSQKQLSSQTVQAIWQELTFGFRYLLGNPSLLGILIFLLINNLIDSINFAILPAMILARSGNDSAVWGRILTTFGIGGVLGAATIGVLGGPKRRIHGLLLGSAIWKVGLITVSIAQTMWLKLASALGSGFISPFPNSSNQAIWMSKVKPDIQGRVFAARDLITQIAMPLGAAIAGPLADNFFEPAMQTGGSLAGLFGGLFGKGIGAGMGLMITLFASCGLLIGLVGYAFPVLRQVEDNMPDHET